MELDEGSTNCSRGMGYWGRNLVRVFYELGALEGVAFVACGHQDS